MKLYLYFVGKPRDRSANNMAAEYVKRTTRYAPCEMREVDPLRFDPWDRHPGALKTALDPAGKMWDSAEFAHWLSELEDMARDTVFLVGGHDGLPAEWRQKASVLLSLSRMTLPHELARVLLAEQIYRAFATLRGHPYAR